MPSERESVAMTLADTVAFGGLGKEGHRRGDHAWLIPFKKAGVIEGTIHVHSPRSIIIQWKTPLKRGADSFKRSAEAIEFFRKYIR